MTETLLLVKGIQLFANAARQRLGEGEAGGGASPVAHGLHDVAARLGEVSEGLKEIRGILAGISKSIDELVGVTARVSETLVSVAKNAPALKAEGHVERGTKAINAGLFDIALSELSEAEALDRTNYKLWLAYLVWRAGVGSSGLADAERDALLARVPHGAEEELGNGARLLNAEDGVEQRWKLLLNYGFLALALLFGREDSARHLVRTTGSLLVSSKILNLDNAPLYLGPLERLVAEGERESLLGEPLGLLRGEYQDAVEKVRTSWCADMEYPLTGYHYDQYKKLSERAEGFRSLLRPDDLAALNNYEAVYRATQDDSSALAQLRMRRDAVRRELARWSEEVVNSSGETGEEQEAITKKDVLWLGVILVAPWVAGFLLPFRMFFSVPALYAVLVASWRLHRIFYTAPARRFERERPALEEEELKLNGEVAAEASRLRGMLGSRSVTPD